MTRQECYYHSASVGTDNLADESRHSPVSDQALTSSADQVSADRVVGSSLEVGVMMSEQVGYQWHDWDYPSDVIRVCSVCGTQQERDAFLSGDYDESNVCYPERKDTMVTVYTPACGMCGVRAVIEMTDKQFARYNSGALIQDAIPELSADVREMLITGTCPECWAKIFNPEEEKA